MVRSTIFIVVVCAFILQMSWATKEFRLDILVQNAEDGEEVDQVFARTRSLLSPDEKQLLEEILAADEVIMERQQRGIVDQILATISGVGSGFGIFGGSGAQLVGVAPTAAPAATARPTAAKADLNATTAAATAAVTMAPARAPTQAANNDNHLFSQISSVITNSNRRNVSGIVDAALSIGTPAPVRDLVNGIIGVAYCNGIRRLLGRC